MNGFVRSSFMNIFSCKLLRAWNLSRSAIIRVRHVTRILVRPETGHMTPLSHDIIQFLEAHGCDT